MSNQKTVIQVDRALLPALFSALRLASARAVCESNPKLREHMKLLNEQVKALVHPVVFTHFSENEWSEFLLHLAPGTPWSIHAERRSRWSDTDARIVLQTGNIRVRSKYLIGVDINSIDIGKTLKLLGDEIEAVAPVDCQRIDGVLSKGCSTWDG